VLHEAGGWSVALRTADVPTQREVLAVLVERVVPVRVRRGRYQAVITWTHLGAALRQAAAAVRRETAA
jgi:hypothetical protein